MQNLSYAIADHIYGINLLPQIMNSYFSFISRDRYCCFYVKTIFMFQKTKK